MAGTGAVGYCDPETQTIGLVGSQPNDSMQDTFLHEVFHAKCAVMSTASSAAATAAATVTTTFAVGGLLEMLHDSEAFHFRKPSYDKIRKRHTCRHYNCQYYN